MAVGGCLGLCLGFDGFLTLGLGVVGLGGLLGFTLRPWS
jgi:hypothetical protein